MEHVSRGPASFLTQANALFRKNVNFQKRNLKTNVGIISVPVLLCVLLVVIQNLVNHELDKPENRCGCSCIDTKGNSTCENACGIQYSNSYQVLTCPIPRPPEWPALLQIPRPQYRALRTDSVPFMNPPATIILTGGNRSLAESLVGNFLGSTSLLLFPDLSSALSKLILGTDTDPGNTQFVEPAFVSHRPLYYVQSQCLVDVALPLPKQIATAIQQDVKRVKCVQILPAWLDSFAEVNKVLFSGYQQGNSRGDINEFVAAYDFLNSDEVHFNVRIWYNSTSKNGNGNSPITLVRVPRLLNLVSNAYLEFMKDSSAKVQFDFVKEMPKAATQLRLDFSSLLGPLFFTWVVELLFPVMLTYLVYEKQQKLKIMMKMHGLGEGAYWMISYAYLFVISIIYMTSFIIFGSITGLKFFLLNDYSIQFVFFFVCINLQIALAFLTATMFSDVKTATVIGYIYVFGSGLLGAFLFQSFVEDISFSRGLLLLMEIFPGFSLYRGLYEFSQYSFMGNYIGTSGMLWRNLNDSNNGMRDILIIMSVEWLVLLPVAYYLDQVASLGSGVKKNPLFFLQHLRRKPSVSLQNPSLRRQGPEVHIDMEKPDVSQERKVVEQLLCEPSTRYGMVCDNVKKIYPARDGNPEKFAVRGLSLALPRGECFGMLGPNGAGKTSFINMMIGLTAPTSGTAYIGGLDICADMDKIYSSMGVCPQHDLLWETLTGREHLMFYGRLKNLKGAALTHAVEESLKAVNLFHAGIDNKQAGQYSGGMKRRLSVAISLIGNPKVVYMDEPSTGLDPASRHNLWDVVRHAKNDRAIILTTHSMEEADVLCDRLGIFVNGSLQCIGNPKELKARYGGSYVLTVTTASDKEEEVETLAMQLSPNAKKIYHISGTQKFELPKQDVRITDVFEAVENAKSKFPINAWGFADTTLEDVFFKVAKGTIVDAAAPP